MSNQYQQHNLYVQSDTGPLVAQVADARHSAAMQQVGNQYRKHLRVTAEEARQSCEALKIQQANLESQFAAASRIANEEAQEASNRKFAADERLRQTEVEADQLHNQGATDIRQIADQQVRQAYAAAHQAEALAELKSKNFAHELNYFKSELSDVLGHLRSEQSAKNEADARSRSLAAELQKINHQMQRDAPEGPTQISTSSTGPLEYHMGSPPGLEPEVPKTRIPEGGPPDDHDDDDDGDDDDDKRRKDKKSKKDKKKKRDSSDPSSSSSIPRDVMKALIKKMIRKDGDEDKDKDKGDKDKKEKTKEAEKVVFPKFPQPESYRNWRLKVREAVVADSNKPDLAFSWLSKVWDKETKVDDPRDTDGFATLDAKVVSAITNVLEGEFARQIDSFKEREAHAGRLVRGRQGLASSTLTLLPALFMVRCTSSRTS